MPVLTISKAISISSPQHRWNWGWRHRLLSRLLQGLTSSTHGQFRKRPRSAVRSSVKPDHPNTLIDEPRGSRQLLRIDIAQIHEDIASHHVPHLFESDRPELIPLCQDDEYIGLLRGLDGTVTPFDSWKK